jgi:gas vesicle protein
MEQGRRSSFGDFLSGIVIGGAIGYVLALLWAPRPGEETRTMLAERGREVRDAAKETVQTAVDKTGKLVTESRGRLESTMEATAKMSQERADEVKERGTTMIHDARVQTSETLHRVADQIDPESGPALDLEDETRI